MHWLQSSHTKLQMQYLAQYKRRQTGKNAVRFGNSTYQVPTDPCTDKAEGQHSELEELCAAVHGQEAEALGQHTACEGPRECQTPSKCQRDPAYTTAHVKMPGGKTVPGGAWCR